MAKSALGMVGAGMKSEKWNRQKLELFGIEACSRIVPWLHGEFEM